MKKLIEKKNQMIKVVAQSIADSLVDALGIAMELDLPMAQKEMICFYGLLLDNYMIKNHNVYLK